jgi:uncharacterized protein
MKIYVKDITENPTIIEDTVSSADWDMDSSDIRFLDDIHMVGRFSRVGSEILADVTVSLTREITCGRCLEVVVRKESQRFMFSYERSKLGDVLDVDSDIREEILLNWPMKTLCSEECKGLDPETGEKIM